MARKKTVQQRIVAILKKTGWSQRELADRMDMSQSSVSMMFNGLRGARPNQNLIATLDWIEEQT